MSIPYPSGMMGRGRELVAWWRASSGTYQDVARTTPATVQGQEVRSWVDTIGGYPLAQYPASPVTDGPNLAIAAGINGLHSIDFTGAVFLACFAPGLISHFSGSDRSLSLIFVAKQDDLASTRTAIAIRGGPDATGGAHVLDTIAAGPVFRARRRGTGGAIQTQTGGTPTTSAYVRAHVASGSPMVVDEWVNAGQIIGPSAPLDDAPADMSVLLVGSNILTAGAFLDGMLAEVMLYRVAISTAEREGRQAVFTTMYAL